MKDDELDGLDKDKDVNEPTTESDADKIVRLETENKSFKDGSSRLGREFKSYKEDNEGKYEELLKRVSEIADKSTGEPSNDNLDNDYEDDDVKRVEKIVDKRMAKAESDKATIQTQYVSDYSKAITKLGTDEDDEIYEAILIELETLPGYSNNGMADAQRNYEIAERNYYKRLYKSPTTTTTTAFKEEKAHGEPGGSSTVTHKEGSDEEVAAALKDPYVQEYMKRMRKSPEDVKKAIQNNKTPMAGKMRI